jgi:MBG domain (YGX type)
VSRIYGDANPSNGAATGNAGGLVNGDTVASVTLGTPATVTSNVGTYSTSGGNAVFGSGLASNYAISFAGNPAGLSITPRPLTLTPDAVSRIYGDANPSSGSATGNAGGLVNGDTVASVTLGTPATLTSRVGSYATSASNAVLGKGSAGNYAISYTDNAAGLRVTPRALTVAALPNQGKLPGRADPVLGYAIAGGNLVNGDTLSGQLARQPGEAPGLYPIEQGSLGAGDNYLLDYRGALFAVGRSVQVATLDRNPSQSTVLASAQSRLPVDLNALPPPAAGPSDASLACVREQALDRDGVARITNRGMRLPDSVVDLCR